MAKRKSVVVRCESFNRVVSFESDEHTSETELLKDAIRDAYRERISPCDRLTLQVESEEWVGGVGGGGVC